MNRSFVVKHPLQLVNFWTAKPCQADMLLPLPHDLVPLLAGNLGWQVPGGCASALAWVRRHCGPLACCHRLSILVCSTRLSVAVIGSVAPAALHVPTPVQQERCQSCVGWGRQPCMPRAGILCRPSRQRPPLPKRLNEAGMMPPLSCPASAQVGCRRGGVSGGVPGAGRAGQGHHRAQQRRECGAGAHRGRLRGLPLHPEPHPVGAGPPHAGRPRGARPRGL